MVRSGGVGVLAAKPNTERGALGIDAWQKWGARQMDRTCMVRYIKSMRGWAA
jgi:hypothetical protein